MDYERWKKKKAKALKEGDLSQLVVCCKELADHFVINEQYNDALEEYKEMERAADAMNSELDVARANRMIGEMYCEIGNFDKAIHHQEKHLDISRNHADRVEEQRALATLGRTYFMMSEIVREGDIVKKNAALNSAKQFFTASLSVCDQLSDALVGSKQKTEMRARLFLNLGLVSDDEGNVDSAINYINKAVCMCKKVDLWEDLFKAYIGLGCTYNKNGMKKEAISTFDKAINVGERLSSKVMSVCEALNHKAEALIDLPDFRGARQSLLRAYKLNCSNSDARKEIETKLRIVAAMCVNEVKLTDLAPDGQENERKVLYEDLGDMASELRHFSIALTYYTLMLECVEKSNGDSKQLIECYVSLAQTYKDNKQYKKAVDFFKKEVALEKENPEESCKTYLNIAELYQIMDKNENALEAFKAASSCAELSQNSRLHRTVISLMVQHFTEQNDLLNAEKTEAELQKIPVDDEEASDEESDSEKPVTEFGAHIILDDITDDEFDSQDEVSTTKLSRTRAKPKSNIHKKNELGETPLHRAAITGNLALSIKLLDQGHSVDVRDFSGWTPLHEAANHGYLEIAELLLKKGAAVNDRGGAECNGVTPLLDAASCGHLAMMDLLLSYKASPLMKNNDGMTVLDLMTEWKVYAERENDGGLDSEIIQAYDSMYTRLQQILERAGCKQSVVPPPGKKQTNVAVQRTNSRKVLYEDGDDHVKPTLPVSRRDEEKPYSSSKSLNKSIRKSGAASEYESAMRAIRFRSKDQSISPLAHDSKPPALVLAGDLVNDDWLEEDIVRPNKKRRRTNEFLGQPLKEPRDEETSTNLHSTPISESMFPESGNESDDDGPTLTQPVLSSQYTSSCSASTSGSSSNRLKINNLSRRNETSPPRDQNNGKIGKMDPEVKVVPQSSSMICVRVLVEDKLLLVPVPSINDDLTVEWLVEETAKRYKCLEGIEPILRLLTSDGAFLLNSDSLSLVFSMGELRGQVLSWKLPSLVGSYEELCASSNLVQDRAVVSILEACRATNAADFSDTYLDTKHLSCAVKVLSHHHPLQSLNLSGCNISDESIKDLTENIVKLPNLRILNLSNVNITGEGLAIFSQIVKDNKGFQVNQLKNRLGTLDIGFNPLGECLKTLGNLINNLPALADLIIPSIDLTTQSFRGHLDFTLDTLERINVSYNDIGTVGIIDLLGRLSPRCVQELLLSHTGGNTIREVGLYLQVNAPPSLRTLDLSYCPATDDDMHELIQGLEMCPHLDKLILEGVCGLVQKNVDELMNCKHVRHLNLGGTFTVQQPLQVTEHLASLAISSYVDQNWGQKSPYSLFSTPTVRHTTFN